jgi:Domain of unknown function (DUF4386)
MSWLRNPGRVAGFWYLLLIVIGPVRLIYIPAKLFVRGDVTATVNNIAAHEWLFRVGIVSLLVGALVLIFLTIAFYRLFAGVDRNLAVQVVIFGGVMPSVIYLFNVALDASALRLVHGGDFVSTFSNAQRDALVMLLLRLHDDELTATLLLAGVWLFPLGILVYRSRFLPRFLGIWLLIAGCGWIILCFTGFLAPQYRDRELAIFQPAFFAELALMLWLVIKGAKPPPLDVTATSSPVV